MQEIFSGQRIIMRSLQPSLRALQPQNPVGERNSSDLTTYSDLWEESSALFRSALTSAPGGSENITSTSGADTTEEEPSKQ